MAMAQHCNRAGSWKAGTKLHVNCICLSHTMLCLLRSQLMPDDSSPNPTTTFNSVLALAYIPMAYETAYTMYERFLLCVYGRHQHKGRGCWLVSSLSVLLCSSRSSRSPSDHGLSPLATASYVGISNEKKVFQQDTVSSQH